MLSLSPAGSSSLRVDDDKMKELTNQPPPRIPRTDEHELSFRANDVSSHSNALPPSPIMPYGLRPPASVTFAGPCPGDCL